MRKFIVLGLVALLTFSFSGMAIAEDSTSGKVTGSIRFYNNAGLPSWAEFSVHGSDHPHGVTGSFYVAVDGLGDATVDVICFVQNGDTAVFSGLVVESNGIWGNNTYVRATVADGGSPGAGNDYVKFDADPIVPGCGDSALTLLPVTSGNLKVHD
jgi:hypothetical protein